jgi:hypothetical protein
MRIPLLLAAIPLMVPAARGQEDVARSPEAYRRVVEQTAAMVSDAQARDLTARHGLQVLNVTWEDTGRYKGSAVGPNISDMTIQVQVMDPRTEKARLYCMPVIRFPNFSDRSADLSPDKFLALVGNEKGERLRAVTLRELLGNFRKYLAKPDSWKGERTSLLADRDTHVLVSAQACFLPIPKQGIAEFNPVLFNYQSYEGDPAVMSILVTREGTSATVIDNKRDGFQAGQTWGQRLFFNKKGDRCVLTGKRASDFRAEGGAAAGPGVEANEQGGLNMVLLIQVPLRQKRPMGFDMYSKGAALPAAAPGGGKRRSDVEDAVIGHGRVEGPFTEVDNLEIQRDARYPIRVTVQFYKATSNGVVSAEDISEIARQIEKVYQHADYVGSLVTEGHTGRPTEYEGDKSEPPGWWRAFWGRHETNTGLTREDTMRMLRKLLGPDWTPRSAEELTEAVRQLK